MNKQHTTSPSHPPGFTLVEVLLVISLLALLAGMTYPLFKTDTPYQKLERSANRLGSLLAMCRAEAMLQGHPFRITWPALTEDRQAVLQPVVMHETDPVNAPGQYNEVAAAWAREPVLEPGVDLRLVQSGIFDISSLSGSKGRFTVPTEPSLVNVQFQPDGTADPAVFVLTATTTGDEQEELQHWVIVDEITGLCKVREPPTAKQYDAMLAQQDALVDLQFQEKAVEIITTPDQEGDSQQQTLASLLNGGTGGGNALSNTDLQEILTQLQPLLNQARSGTSAGGATPGGSASTGGNPRGSGNTPSGNTSGSGNRGGNANAGNRGGNGNANTGNRGNNNNNGNNRTPSNQGPRGNRGNRVGR